MPRVRTRFAPSPTGYMHIGNLRTALYAYLIAKSHGGDFILRIEDTDQEREVEGAVEFIYRTMRLTGLNYDEGPDVGGDYGPYVQSQRKEIYRKYAMMLVDKGAAYPCFCSKERIERLREEAQKRKQPFRYDRCCLSIDPHEARRRIEAGEPFVVRQKMPQSGATTFSDAVYGEITVDNSTLEDQILLKSDGLPTYNFANVVDDHLMEISHVVRGSEYLSSTPKYNLLYEAFGWEIPTYVHLPPIMKEEGKKLSKRHGDASFEDFYNKGYLKEAIINYIALLGWNPGTEQEIFSLEELVEQFSISGISKSPAIFDINKLRWMNGVYIRSLSLEQFHELALPYYEKVLADTPVDLHKLSEVLQSRTEVLGEIPETIGFLAELPEYSTELYRHKKMKTDEIISLESLKQALPVLEQLDDWSEKAIAGVLSEVVKANGWKTGQVFWPVRVAISGKQFTPGGATSLAEVLGKEETLRRIRVGIEKLEQVV